MDLLEERIVSYRSVGLAVCLMVLSQWSVADDWVLAEAQDGIRISLRDVPDSGIQAFRATVSIATSLDSIMAVFSDIQACPQWFHQCDESAQIQRDSFAKRVNYQVSDFPFPAGDRDLVYQVLLSQDVQSKTITMDIKALPDYCVGQSTPVCQQVNAADYVRMTKATGFYRFVVTDKGVDVTWQQHTEPGGALPDWLVNAMVVDIPRNTLQGLREIVKQDKYQKAKLAYEAGVAVGFLVK